VRFLKHSLLGYMVHHFCAFGQTQFKFDLSSARGEVRVDDSGSVLAHDYAVNTLEWLKQHNFNVSELRASHALALFGFSDNDKFHNTANLSIPFRSCERAVSDYLKAARVSVPQPLASFVVRDFAGRPNLKHHYFRLPGAEVDVSVTPETHFDVELLHKIRRLYPEDGKFWQNEYAPWHIAYMRGQPEQENPIID